MSKSLLVHKQSNTIITPEILSCYVDSYTICKTDDPHARFADLIGTTRCDAKTLSYFISYKIVNCKTIQKVWFPKGDK